MKYSQGLYHIATILHFENPNKMSRGKFRLSLIPLVSILRSLLLGRMRAVGCLGRLSTMNLILQIPTCYLGVAACTPKDDENPVFLRASSPRQEIKDSNISRSETETYERYLVFRNRQWNYLTDCVPEVTHILCTIPTHIRFRLAQS